MLAQRGGGLSYGKETVFLSQLCITNDRFAKTGSGQTWGKLKNETVFSQLGGVPSPPDSKAAQAAAAKAAAAVAMAGAGELELGELPLPSWSVLEVGEWLKGEVGATEQVRKRSLFAICAFN